MVNRPLIRPYLWGGGTLGGRLTSHDFKHSTKPKSDCSGQLGKDTPYSTQAHQAGLGRVWVVINWPKVCHMSCKSLREVGFTPCLTNRDFGADLMYKYTTTSYCLIIFSITLLRFLRLPWTPCFWRYDWTPKTYQNQTTVHLRRYLDHWGLQ